MANYNTDILVRNIKALMKDKNITQEKLANILGMSQPNISKALNESDKKSFALDQVVGIAKHFAVSVDYLLGNYQSTDTKSEKDICKLFTSLIEKRKLIKVDYSREEEIYTPISRNNYPDCDVTKENINYCSFIFPSYFDPGPLDRYDEEQIDNLHQDVLFCGNNDDSNIRINAFFTRYFQIYNMFLHNQMTEELFHEITEKFMADLH